MPFGQSGKFSKLRWQYATIFSVYLYRKACDFPGLNQVNTRNS
jgi:hypothetical protein